MIIDSGVVTGSLTSQGSMVVTGSVTATTGFSGSLFGSASFAVTASYWSGSIGLATTASYAITASYLIGQSATASYALTASYWSGSVGLANTASNAQTASSADNFTVRGTLTAQTIVVQTISSSVTFDSGSNRFGNDITNTQTFTGSVGITGSLAVVSNITGSNIRATSGFVGNLSGNVNGWTALDSNGGEIRININQFKLNNNITLVWSQTTDSNGTKDLGIRRNTTGSLEIYDGVTADGAIANRRDLLVRNITGSNALISGSLIVSGSIISTFGFTGSLSGSASNATTASYAITASNANTASYIVTAQTASYVLTAQTASYVLTAQTASYIVTAQTASYILNAISASFATTASYATNAANAFIQGGNSFGTTATIGTNDNQALNLETNNTSRIVIYNDGNIRVQPNYSPSSSTRPFMDGMHVDNHPEGDNPAIIPYLGNDIAYLTLKGGTFTGTPGPGSTVVTSATLAEYMFDGSPTYAGFTSTDLSGSYTASIAFPQSYYYGNTIGFSFGNTVWRAQNFKVEILVTGSYYTLDTVANWQYANYNKSFNYADQAVQGARITFSNFYYAPGFRIADIFLLNYNSIYGKGIYLGKDGGQIYKGITVTGSVIATAGGFTGSLQGTATTASYASTIAGGTTNYIPLWSANTTLTSSALYQSGGNIVIGSTNTGYGNLGVYNATNALIGIANSTSYAQLQQNGADLYINTNLGGAAGGNLIFRFGAGSTEYMRITSTGNVGIGTTSPSSILDIQSAQAVIKLTSTTGTNTVYSLYINTSGNFYVGKDNSTGTAFGVANATILYEGGDNPMVFWTNSQQRMRITSGGNVGIGTTTPNAKLDVNGNTLITGSLTVTSTITELSSLRYKENIQPISFGLDKVLQMRGVSYIKKDTQLKEIGVIAEEMNKILPDIVHKSSDGQVESVSYSRITAVLIEAIKELKAEIDILKNK